MHTAPGLRPRITKMNPGSVQTELTWWLVLRPRLVPKRKPREGALGRAGSSRKSESRPQVTGKVHPVP